MAQNSVYSLKKRLVMLCAAAFCSLFASASAQTLPAPPNFSATPTNGEVSLKWSAVSAATSYNLKRAAVSGGPYTSMANLTAANYTDVVVVSGTPYYYVVTAVNASGESTNSLQVTATPSGSVVWSPPWQTQDIGPVGYSGSAGYTNGVFTVTGSGADMYSTGDEFRYVFLSVTNDCSIVAQVLTVQNANSWCKAGVMIRETVLSNSINAFVGMTPGNGATWQYRSSTGGGTTYNKTTGLTAPYWVKMVRSGSTLTGYISADGAAWKQQGTASISMATNACIGLAVTAHDNSSLCPATFSNVVVSPLWPIQFAPSAAGVTNQTVIAASNTMLNATVSGYPVPELQWRSNTVALVNQTNSSLTLNNVQYSQNGTVYSLVASNAFGVVTNYMTLTVLVTPAITGLANQAASIGATVTISTTVSGVPTPATRWWFGGNILSDGATGNGSTISGSTTGTLIITNAQAADTGVYFLVATNIAGLVTNSMTLTVSSTNVAPGIVGPTDQSVVQSNNATFTVSASGLPLPTLQWRLNGTAIAGQTNSSLTVSNVQYSQNGYVYSVVASNVAGLATNGATLYVLVPPTISAQPTNLVVTNTQSATFAVTAGGVPTPAYQWFFNGNWVSGVTTSNYSIAKASATNMGNYYVIVSNSVSSVTSSVATLTVNSTMSPSALTPANGSTGICYDTPLYITFSSPPVLTTPGTGKIRIYNVTNSTTPVDTLDMSKNFTISSPYAVNTQSYTNGPSVYSEFPVIITSNTAAIYPHPGMLASNQTYYVLVDNGVFTDTNGAYFAGVTASNVWKFTTKIAGPANATNLVVAQDYSGDFATVQGAVNSVASGNTTPTIINLRNGTYTEVVLVYNKNNITFRGQPRSGARMCYLNNVILNPGSSLCAVFKVNTANDVAVENLTITNLTPQGVAQAFALMVDADSARFICNNAEISGYQDTIFINQVTQTAFFNNSLIQGDVDYIWGSGVGFFTNCQMNTLRATGGYVTQPRAPAGSNGLSFVNCSFTVPSSGYSNSVFARAIGVAYGNTVLIHCRVDTNGYNGWNATDVTNTSLSLRWWEYGNSNLLATAPAVFNGTQLASTDSNLTNASSATLWLGGWTPKLAPNIVSQPANQSVNGGQQVSFAVSATGVPEPTYQWKLNGAALSGATNATLVFASASVTNAGTYLVVVSNASGTMTSSNATLTITGSAPAITTQPANQTVALGGAAVLAAAASGAPTPAYQWFQNGAMLPNATNVTLTLTNVQAMNIGAYFLIASNSYGTAASANAALTVTGGVFQLPVINLNNIIVVTNSLYNAAGDGVADNTTAIQKAINTAALGGLTNGLRGGTVEIPAGTNTYLCGPLNFSNNVNLQIDAGAVLQLLPYGSWPGSPYTGTVSSLLNGSGLTNIAVTGPGLIDGQGAAWWPRYSTNNRPVIVNFSSCSEVLLQNFTSSNPPVAHIVLKGANAGNINVIGVKLFAPDSSDPVNPSHNTDGCDFAETNALFQDCVISTGDDNIALGSSGSVSRDILVTNCFFGYGHGVSIGSYTSGGVSNLMVISCTFSNTGNGIKIKSERNRGGVVQNLNYYNITMTNVGWPIQFYSYYEYGLGTLTTVTPEFAASTAFTSTNPVPYEPPIYRNITISNVTANVPNGRPPLLIWGLPDYPISNVVFKAVNLISSSTSISGIYHATNIQFVDCSLPVPAGNPTVQFWNANIIFTNSSASTNLYLLSGLTTNGIGNTLAFYNALGALSNTNALAGGAVAMAGSTLTVSNNLSLTSATPLNYVVGTNPAILAVKGNLALGGGVNVAAGPGFTNGTYTLMSYTGSFSGSLPTLGSTPSGYSCVLSSATTNQINLIVASLPGTPANLTASATNLLIHLNWFTSANAAGFNLKRSATNGGQYSLLANLSATNYSDSAVMPGTTYYYVVAATNVVGESGNSAQVGAAPLPSNVPTNLNLQADGNQLQLSWPADHLGWRLQIQTNSVGLGLGANWITVSNSTNINAANIVINPAIGSAFLRLVYP